jgi:3-hydroxybutyryl-CoA dehydrogenase
MEADDIRRVLVVGAGTMGQQIALQCAGHGFEVVMLDADPQALGRAEERLAAMAAALVGEPAFAGADLVQAVAAIRYETDPGAAATEVDLVSESVPEDPALKGKVFAELDAVCPERTVFATNTIPTPAATALSAVFNPCERFVLVSSFSPIMYSLMNSGIMRYAPI